jgi:hypothetical protein
MKGNGERRTLNMNLNLVRANTRPITKDITIDNITNSIPVNPQKEALSLPPKKNNLFRCHSVKMKGSSRKA